MITFKKYGNYHTQILHLLYLLNYNNILIKKSKKHNKNIDFLPRFVYDKYNNKRNKQVNIYNKRMGAKIVGKIISVANQKGGVGKTTTTINLSTMLAKKGKKVLLIDADPQGNATSGVGAEKEVEYSTYDILVSDVEMVQALEKTIIKNLLVCPSNINLAGAEVELVSMMSREQRLKEKLEEIKDKFDYILIDCPPSLGLITLNAFTASDSVLIPVQCEYYALEGLGQLLNTINLVKKHLNKNLEVEGALLTMYDARTNLSNQVVKEVKKYFGDKVYKTVIPRNVRLSEAPSYGMPITEYDPRSKGAKTYEKFTKEFLKINDAEKKGKHLIKK